ncbi:MAG: response regulator transcription factor [Bacteroidales bacterium]|nr:response regulator transcription factor [Bacteroidales bacterium]
MKNGLSILFVEPDEDFARSISLYAQKKHAGVLKFSAVTHWQDLWNAYQHHLPDIVLLTADFMTDSLQELVRRLREASRQLTVVCLYDDPQPVNMALAFRAGADECIWKHTMSGEGWIRLERLIWQAEQVKMLHRVFRIGAGSVFDAELQTLDVYGMSHRLPRSESRILEMLCARINHVVSHQELLRCCDPGWEMNTNSRDRAISHLRKYLSADVSVSLESIKSTGYVLKVAPR